MKTLTLKHKTQLLYTIEVTGDGIGFTPECDMDNLDIPPTIAFKLGKYITLLRCDAEKYNMYHLIGHYYELCKKSLPELECTLNVLDTTESN